MINHNHKEANIKVWVEMLIFLSSYYPLFLILLIRDLIEKSDRIQFGLSSWNLTISYSAIILFILSSLATLIVAPLIRKLTTYQQGGIVIKIIKSEQIRGDMLNYTLPFLIGLFGFNYESMQSILSLIVFLLFMFAFIHEERMSLLNPMFLLLGIRLYNISYKEIGRNVEYNKLVLTLGYVRPSNETIKIKENSGINFVYPNSK